jgi:hypothetical protein
MPCSDPRLLVAMLISAKLLRPKRTLWQQRGLALPKGKKRLSITVTMTTVIRRRRRMKNKV